MITGLNETWTKNTSTHSDQDKEHNTSHTEIKVNNSHTDNQKEKVNSTITVVDAASNETGTVIEKNRTIVIENSIKVTEFENPIVV